MKITTLSEMQRRSAARRGEAPSAPTMAIETHADNSWTTASQYEPRPPLAAKAFASKRVPQRDSPAQVALRSAQDDGWPHASNR
jgi:hypothetical protein